MGLLLELLVGLVIGARRIGDIESALLVEIGDNRPIDQRRPGNEFDLEAGGKREGVAIQLDFLHPGGDIAREELPGGSSQEQSTCQGQAFHAASLPRALGFGSPGWRPRVVWLYARIEAQP